MNSSPKTGRSGMCLCGKRMVLNMSGIACAVYNWPLFSICNPNPFDNACLVDKTYSAFANVMIDRTIGAHIVGPACAILDVTPCSSSFHAPASDGLQHVE